MTQEQKGQNMTEKTILSNNAEGYPLFYVHDGELLCNVCMQDLIDENEVDEKVVEGQIYWEGAPMECSNCGEELESAYGPVVDDPKIKALMEYLELKDPDDISQSSYNDCSYDYGTQEYLICDEDEAEVKWEESLDSYLEDCVYPELPESFRYYFDDVAWKEAAKYDGRGHSLSSYDGAENEYKVDGKWFYIYRLN